MALQRDAEAAEGRAGRLTLLLPTVWLVFLALPVAANWSRRDEPVVLVGYGAVLAFAAVYVAAFEAFRRVRRQLRPELPAAQGWAFVATLVLLEVLMTACLKQDAIGASIFVAVTAAMVLPVMHALPFVPVLSYAVFESRRLPGFETDVITPLVVLAAGFVAWGVKQVIARNLELVVLREQDESEILSQERHRFAQDLHDILGHSLTVITVKAELANRMLDIDAERARRELRDLERLARDALADVRRAVNGYKDLSLSGEIIRARQALRTAGIAAVVPGSADQVPSELRDLFAWTIREGVTNVIRHSNASTCTVELFPDRVVVADDGAGPRHAAADGGGNGLSGLAERAALVGAVVTARSLAPRGFELEVRGTRR